MKSAAILKSTAAQHGATINDLAERGLKATGYYEQPGSAAIVYHLEAKP